MQLRLTEVPIAPPQAAPQLATEPAGQQHSLYDLLMDAMKQPAAAAAGLTGEMASGFLGLLPVQAEKVRRSFFAVASGTLQVAPITQSC
jgi:hypothetical protein